MTTIEDSEVGVSRFRRRLTWEMSEWRRIGSLLQTYRCAAMRKATWQRPCLKGVAGGKITGPIRMQNGIFKCIFALRKVRKSPSCSIQSDFIFPLREHPVGQIDVSRRPSRVIGKDYLRPETRELNRASAGIESDTYRQSKAHSSTPSAFLRH